MDLDLKGKTIIITGGSGGIGQGLVMEFAREGCNVLSASRDAATGQKLAQEAKQQGLHKTAAPRQRERKVLAGHGKHQAEHAEPP